MSSAVQIPSRSLLRALKSQNQNSACSCSRSKRLLQASQRRWQSTTAVSSDDGANSPPTSRTQSPRWAATPAAMKAPVRTRPTKPGWKPFECNNNPDRLDAMYVKLLGKTGPKMLSDETKWLAVTHKSFDFGRRGFNDRLAFLGRQIIELQTSLELLNAADPAIDYNTEIDQYGRQPFYDAATASAEVLSSAAKESFLKPGKVAQIAAQYDIPEVVRWLPKNPDSLKESGATMVYTQALYAIVGALALEQGALVANRVARERILQPMALLRGIGDGGRSLDSSSFQPLNAQS